mmetsp:Transcript_29911/g.41649  ORF Transcript_29911/g.41649 Transcript_29911/m.41649 type:complete len:593 (-) Transcript_29911:107-1885(-)
MRPTLRKILSDVDDTLFSSGGRFPAGIDATYKHHELYPGVLAFYKELDLGLAKSNNGEWPPHWRGNLAFLSARPHVYKDWSQAKSYKLFSQLKKSHNLHTTPTLLAGELFSSFQMFRGDFNPMAHKKAQNFFEYSSLYPEYKFVFIGDNGQGDVIAAEMILEKYSERLEGVFIHKVQKLARTPGYTDKSRAKWDDLGIMFFRTYIGASLLACKKNLISIRGLRQVASNAVKDFCKIEFSKEETRFARLQELNRDIEKCNDYLQSQGYPTVAYVAAKHVFARGTMVSTRRYGYGRVLEFRHDDGMYEILLNHPKNSRLYLLGKYLQFATTGSADDRVWTPYGTGILQAAREADGVHIVHLTKLSQLLITSTARAKALSSKRVVVGGSRRHRRMSHKSSSSSSSTSGSTSWNSNRKQQVAMVAYIQPKNILVIRAAVGDVVTSAFGQGVVQSYRRADGIYEVLIPWGNPVLHEEKEIKIREDDSRSKTGGGGGGGGGGGSPAARKEEKSGGAAATTPSSSEPSASSSSVLSPSTPPPPAAAGGGGGRTRGIRMMKGGVVVKAYFTGAQLHRVEHNGFFSSVYRSVVNALSSSSR